MLARRISPHGNRPIGSFEEGNERERERERERGREARKRDPHALESDFSRVFTLTA